MKFVVLLVAICAIVSSVAALKNKVCGLAHSADGNSDGLRCLALFRLWTYKKDSNECQLFDYGGCGGNANRFDTKEACEAKCKEQIANSATRKRSRIQKHN